MRQPGARTTETAPFVEWADEVPGGQIVRIDSETISIGRRTNIGDFREEFSANRSELFGIHVHPKRWRITVMCKPPPLRSFALGSLNEITHLVSCSSEDSRDRLIECMARALANEFDCERSVYPRGKTIKSAVSWLLITAILSGLIASIAQEASAGLPLTYEGRWRVVFELIYPILGQLGCAGVWATGAMIAFVVVVFAIRRMGDPRVMITFVRREESRANASGLSIKR